ncbi:hypothetical protein BJV78DRAFT_1152275 [Lactifluus subvellereus]|nr:hypothetical protein BJV78DRAFT_1152275 [Lactifluus subvellereus]
MITPAVVAVVNLSGCRAGNSARDVRYREKGLQLDKNHFANVEERCSISLPLQDTLSRVGDGSRRKRAFNSIYVERTNFGVKIKFHPIVETCCESLVTGRNMMERLPEDRANQGLLRSQLSDLDGDEANAINKSCDGVPSRHSGNLEDDRKGKEEKPKSGPRLMGGRQTAVCKPDSIAAYCSYEYKCGCEMDKQGVATNTPVRSTGNLNVPRRSEIRTQRLPLSPPSPRELGNAGN